jgi:hypothetical protein
MTRPERRATWKIVTLGTALTGLGVAVGAPAESHALPQVTNPSATAEHIDTDIEPVVGSSGVDGMSPSSRPLGWGSWGGGNWGSWGGGNWGSWGH